jgi:hypothetical protein
VYGDQQVQEVVVAVAVLLGPALVQGLAHTAVDQAVAVAVAVSVAEDIDV